MNLHIALIVFQVVVLMFAFSLHESAHAWMASRLGDQTARMLGRVTLNPIKHIDPWGSIVMPLIAIISGFPLIGWAKPTPINTRNFKKIVRDDILVTLAGPMSNLLAAIVCLILLLILKHVAAAGQTAVVDAMLLAFNVARGASTIDLPVLFPIALLLYYGILINLTLLIFNLIPVPPLDGSHIFRYLLPYNAQQMYDRIGMIGLVLLFLFGGGVINAFLSPALRAFNGILLGM